MQCIAWYCMVSCGRDRSIGVVAALALHAIGMCCDAVSAVTGYHVLGWQFVGEREYYFDVSRGAMKISYNW